MVPVLRGGPLDLLGLQSLGFLVILVHLCLLWIQQDHLVQVDLLLHESPFDQLDRVHLSVLGYPEVHSHLLDQQDQAGLFHLLDLEIQSDPLPLKKKIILIK